MHVEGNVRRRDALKALGTLPFAALAPLLGNEEPSFVKLSRGHKNKEIALVLVGESGAGESNGKE